MDSIDAVVIKRVRIVLPKDPSTKQPIETQPFSAPITIRVQQSVKAALPDG
jgi:type III secretory pathway lipoprotein EscJ